MALLRNEDERAKRAANEATRRAELEKTLQENRAANAKAKADAAALESPIQQAKLSYERGDLLFQVSLDIEDIGVLMRPMVSADTDRRSTDVSATLNAILAEGWSFHSFSTTFVNEGEVSRDRLLATDQQVAVRGRIVGTYVFTRKPAHPAPGTMTAGEA